MDDRLSSAQKHELRQTLEVEAQRLRRHGPPASVEALLEPRDTQDAAAEEVLRRDDLALSDHERARLRDVEAALRRLEDGTFGICEETGDPIPYARLVAEPTTRYTVEALEVLEQESERERRTDADDGGGLY